MLLAPKRLLVAALAVCGLSSAVEAQTLIAPDGFGAGAAPLQSGPVYSTGAMLAPPPVVLPPQTYSPPASGEWVVTEEWSSPVPTIDRVPATTPAPRSFDLNGLQALPATPSIIAPGPAHMSSPSISAWQQVQPKAESSSSTPEPQENVSAAVRPRTTFMRVPSAAKVWPAMRRLR